MNEEQLIDKMVERVMDEFDFYRVQQVMLQLNWKWHLGNGVTEIPSLYRLMKEAKELLCIVAKYYGKQDFYSCGSGGFSASIDGKHLTLQFILTDMTTHADDFVDTSMKEE